MESRPPSRIPPNQERLQQSGHTGHAGHAPTYRRCDRALPVSGLSDPDVAQIVAQFDKLGVSQEVRPGLLTKIAAGELPDSDSGIVQAVTVVRSTSAGNAVTRSTYPDGSVSVASWPAASSPLVRTGVTPMAITGCAKVYNHGQNAWSNCKVAWDAATWSGSYYLSYMSFGNVTSVIGPYSIVSGGIGASAASVVVNNGGGVGQIGWARFQMGQSINILGIPTYRTVGFDLKVPDSGPTLSSFTG